MFTYDNVIVERVVDGDTIILSIDMGNKITWLDSFRLAGIDTPERGQPGYLEAANRLREMLAHGLSRVETRKSDKYGRYLVHCWAGLVNVNQKMLSEGFAKPYFGGSKDAV